MLAGLCKRCGLPKEKKKVGEADLIIFFFFKWIFLKKVVVNLLFRGLGSIYTHN